MNIPQEINDLIQAYFEGDTSPETCQAIEDWLKQDPANLRLFAEYGCVEDMLFSEQQALDAEAIHAFNAELEHPATPDFLNSSQFLSHAEHEDEPDTITARQLTTVAGYLLRQAMTSKHAFKAYKAAAIVLAATLAIILFFTLNSEKTAPPLAEENIIQGHTQTDQPATANKPVVATLTAQRSAVWIEGGKEQVFALGSDLHPGQRLTLTAGLAEITTARGAVAILEAPATIALSHNDNGLHLSNGKLIGLCHTEQSKGFVIQTDHAVITDLGTEFGVEVSALQVTTTVFTGEVAFKTPDAPSKVITSDQTARLSMTDNRRELVIEDQLAQGFAHLLPRPAIVTAARINLEGFEPQVVPQGVYEDAKLYTDRNHELNGIDEQGIPAFLLGGDLVRMPADARPNRSADIANRDELAVELEVNQLADVYVLMPAEQSRHTSWLNRDYENTGLSVGIDLEHIPGQPGSKPTTQLGTGPGVSIDNTLQVWKRKAPATGTFVAGEGINFAMYSLVVVPHNGADKQQREWTNDLNP
jgi:hypothetical protein